MTSEDTLTNVTNLASTSQQNQTHIPFPKSVFLIVIHKFCEVYCYFGIKAILSLYLRDALLYTEKNAKIIFHTTAMILFLFPLVGAIMADNYLGKFKAVCYIAIFYISGVTLLSFSSSSKFGLPQIPFSMVGLLLLAIGSGSIKPCVTPFGGDQFVLPQQDRQLEIYFSMIAFAVGSAHLLSTFLTPTFRKKVHCLGEKSCFPLAFGTPGIFLVIAMIVFVSGKCWYNIKKPEGNVVIQLVKCIGHALKQKCKNKEQVDHWLDHSIKKYGSAVVNDIKIALKILVLYIPFPFLNALFSLEASAWIFQASRMDGTLGSFTILPDQMPLSNSIMLLMFIPIFNHVIYPALAKCHLLEEPLQRMFCGGIMIVVAYLIAAGVAFALEASYPALPTKGEAQIRMYNPLSCNAVINALPYVVNKTVKSMDYIKIDVNSVGGDNSVNFTISGCKEITYQNGSDFVVSEKTTHFCYIRQDKLVQETDDINKNQKGFPKVRTLVNKPKNGSTLTFWKDGKIFLKLESSNYSIFELEAGTYKLNNFNKELNFYLGGVYTVLVSFDNENNIKRLELYEITKPNKIHILWLLPQYLFLSFADIMIAIPGMNFTYSQAPVSMKSIVYCIYLLMAGVGNFFVVVIEAATPFDKQSHSFLLYAALMFLDMLLFAYLAAKYKYVEVYKEDNS